MASNLWSATWLWGCPCEEQNPDAKRKRDGSYFGDCI